MQIYKNTSNEVDKAKRKQSKFPDAKNFRELAFLVLYEVYALDAFSDISLDRNLNKSNLDTSEKSTATAYVYSTLSKTLALDELISKLSKTPIKKLDKTVLVILRLGLWQIYFSNAKDHAAVSETVKLCQRFGVSSARSLVNAILRNAIRKIPVDGYQPESIYAQTGFNEDLYKLFLDELGSEAEVKKLSEAFNKSLGLNVRIRSGIDGQALPKLVLKNILESSGVDVNSPSFQTDAFNLNTKGKSLHSLDAWKSGHLLAQGEGAMLASLALSPEAGDRVADLCAAPGGKTWHMNDLSNGEAQIVANDIHAHRVQLMDNEIERLELDNIETLNRDAADTAAWNDYSEQFDKILLDVPCTGLGLIHSQPELRFTFDSTETADLLTTQAKILSNADNLLKTGGYILYASCTLNSAENQKQVQEFIQTHKNYELVDLNKNLLNVREKLTSFDGRLNEEISEGMVTLWPQNTMSEGFFIALLKKN